jgi:hypothetical protein
MVPKNFAKCASIARRKSDCTWKETFEGEKVMIKPTDGDDLAAAIREFETALPGWWWTLGYCGVSRDASCGPDYSSNENQLELKVFDNGFHCDDVAPKSTVANSLRIVMRQALAARAELKKDPEAARQRYISTLIERRGFTKEAATARAAEIGFGLKAKRSARIEQ